MVSLYNGKTSTNDGPTAAAPGNNKQSQVNSKRKHEDEDFSEFRKRRFLMPELPDEAKEVIESADLSQPAPSKELAD